MILKSEGLERKLRPWTFRELKRFWGKVDKTGDCWNWTSSLGGKGYGKFYHRGKFKIAQRVSWQITFGVIPAGLCVCHRCDNPKCVNPQHLFIGSYSDNNMDMLKKGRKRLKLTKLQVEEIRKEWPFRRYGFCAAKARKFGVSGSLITQIGLNKSRTFQW